MALAKKSAKADRYQLEDRLEDDMLGPSPSSDEDAVAAAPVAPLQDRLDSA